MQGLESPEDPSYKYKCLVHERDWQVGEHFTMGAIFLARTQRKVKILRSLYFIITVNWLADTFIWSAPADWWILSLTPATVPDWLILSSQQPNWLILSYQPPDWLILSSQQPDRLILSYQPPDWLILSPQQHNWLIRSSQPTDWLSLSSQQPNWLVLSSQPPNWLMMLMMLLCRWVR